MHLLPKKYIFDVGQKTPGNNTPDVLTSYLHQQGAFSGDRLIIVDTAFAGTIAEVVAALARKANYQGKIEGVLLKYAGDSVIENHTLPIRGFNESLPVHEKRKWTTGPTLSIKDLRVVKRPTMRKIKI